MIKKLQNHFTTLEQSNRLLELGVPADSADCYYDKGAEVYDRYNICEDGYFDEHYQSFEQLIPCWSVGRLMEIFELCTGRQFMRRMDRPIVEDIKCRIAFYIFHHKFDFSKLED